MRHSHRRLKHHATHRDRDVLSNTPAYVHRATSVGRNGEASHAGLKQDDRLIVRSVSKANKQIRAQESIGVSSELVRVDQSTQLNTYGGVDIGSQLPDGAVHTMLHRTMTSVEAQTKAAQLGDKVAVQEQKPALEVAMSCTVTGPTAPVVRELRRRIRALEFELLASEHVAATRVQGLRARLDKASGYEGKQSWSQQESDEVFKRLDSVDAVLQDMEGEKESQLEALDEVAGILRDVDKLTSKMIKTHKEVRSFETQTDEAVFARLRQA